MRSGTTRLESLPKRKADFIEPMECALVPKLPEGPDRTFEIKLDGYRAIVVKTSRETILHSRNHNSWNCTSSRQDYAAPICGRAFASGCSPSALVPAIPIISPSLAQTESRLVEPKRAAAPYDV